MSRIKVPALVASGVLAIGLSLSSAITGGGVASANPSVCVSAPFVNVGVDCYDNQWQNVDYGWQDANWRQRYGDDCNNYGCNNGQHNRDWIAEWWPLHSGNPPWPCRLVHTNYGPVQVMDFQHWREIRYEDYGNGNMRFYYL